MFWAAHLTLLGILLLSVTVTGTMEEEELQKNNQRYAAATELMTKLQQMLDNQTMMIEGTTRRSTLKKDVSAIYTSHASERSAKSIANARLLLNETKVNQNNIQIEFQDEMNEIMKANAPDKSVDLSAFPVKSQSDLLGEQADEQTIASLKTDIIRMSTSNVPHDIIITHIMTKFPAYTRTKAHRLIVEAHLESGKGPPKKDDLQKQRALEIKRNMDSFLKNLEMNRVKEMKDKLAQDKIKKVTSGNR